MTQTTTPKPHPYRTPSLPELIDTIQHEPVYQEYASDVEKSDFSKKRALEMGALAAFNHLNEERGERHLDTLLLNLISRLEDFHDCQERLDSFHHRYDKQSRRDIPQEAYEQYENDKASITVFNHVLREVIEAGAGRYNFNGLLSFMVKAHTELNDQSTSERFHDMAREAIIGMRNEAEVQKILKESGRFTVEIGSEEQDARGGDIIVDGVPIDTKASWRSTERAKEKARSSGYNPDIIVWSHIVFDDFAGNLTLPHTARKRVARRLIPDIYQAINSYDPEQNKHYEQAA